LFDEQQRAKPQISITPSAITLACGGGGVLLSFGLCGAAASARLRVFSSVGIVLFGLSLIAIAVGVVWLLAVCIINAFRS